MSPFIKDKDVITLSPCSTTAPQKGDVVGVIEPDTGKLVVHRIVGMDNGRYRIKGDRVKTTEAGSFGSDHICGRITRVERDGKPVWFGGGGGKRAIAVLSQMPLMMRLIAKVMGLKRRIEVRGRRTDVRGRKGIGKGKSK